MIPLPKPRGLRDYTLFALVMSGLLMYLFWIEAGHAIRWADAALACAAAMLCVLGIILARRNEKASWLVQPTWQAKLLLAFGVFLLIFGATTQMPIFCMEGTSLQADFATTS